jgi:hypothetical protein
MFYKLLCVLRAPEDGGSGDGGGTGGSGTGGTQQPAARTFTQDEVNRIAAKQKAEGEAAARRQAEAEFKAREEALVKERDEALLAGKTQAERDAHERKQRDEADRKAREARESAIAKERDEALARAQANEARWKQDRVGTAVTAALHGAKVIAAAAADAAHVFTRDAKIDVDEDGVITNVIYGGKSYPKVEEAAAEFLRERTHFAQPSGTGGTGTRAPGNTGGSGHSGTPLHQQSRQERLDRVAAENAKK